MPQRSVITLAGRWRPPARSRPGEPDAGLAPPGGRGRPTPSSSAAAMAATDTSFAAPGVIHPVTGGIVDRTPNVNLPADFPMRAVLERVLGRRVVIDNDANCAALAEHEAGAARGARVSITVTVGTGVGSGIVVEG